MLTQTQAEWAAYHDWYNSAVEVVKNGEFKGYMVEVIDWQQKTFSEGWTKTYVTFTNFRELREWAGY